MIFKSCIRLCSFLVIFSSLARAQENLLSEEDYFSNIPLVSDASRLPTRKNESPIPISVITREMIEASGAINVADLFRLVPGYQVGHANGGLFSVNPHDLSERSVKRIEVRVNGISAYNSFNSGTIWENLGVQVEDIDRIEITRSPNSVSHGFNSFMGSINIITINPIKEVETSMKARAGNIDYQAGLLRHSDRLGDLHYRFGVDHKTHDGFADVDDNVDVSNISLYTTYSPTLRDELETGLYFGTSKYGRGDIEPPGTPEFFAVTDQQASTEYIKWNHLFDDSNQLNLSFHHRYSMFENTPIFIFGQVPLSSAFMLPPALVPILFGAPDQVVSFTAEGEEHRYEVDMSYTFNSLDKWRIQIGTGLRYETLDSSSLIRDQYASRFSKNIYTSIEWRPTTSWLVNAGLLVQDTNDNSATINPRISLNYHFNNRHAVRGNISYSERNPGLLPQNQFSALRFSNGTLLDAVVFADDEIDNERMVSYGIGYNGNYLNDRLELDLQIYRQEVRDGIDDFPNSSPTGLLREVQFFDNTSDWETTGLEAELKYYFHSHAFIHLNYSYADIDGKRLRGLSPLSFERIDDALAQHSLGILLSRKFEQGYRLSSAYYYQSDMRWLGQNGPVEVNRLDLMGGKEFQVGTSRLDVMLTLQGLLGEYDELQVDNTFEPRAFLEVELVF